MAQIVWTEAARDDLREIHDYIARDSSRWAQATVERIMDATGGLLILPRPADDWPSFLTLPIAKSTGDPTGSFIASMNNLTRYLWLP